jgi:hypothetical protein
MSARVERREGTVDDHLHDDCGAPSAAVRPPASGSRPSHWGRDGRHESRRSSLDGPSVARQASEGRGQPGRHEREDSRSPARSLGTPAPCEEAHGAPSACRCPASELKIHVAARASARRTRQNQDPASRGSRPCVCAVADTPAVLAIVPESLPCLEAAAACVCA